MKRGLPDIADADPFSIHPPSHQVYSRFLALTLDYPSLKFSYWSISTTTGVMDDADIKAG